MYRLLGWIAALGQRARPQSIPPLVLLLALCLFGFCLGLGNYLEARNNSSLPLGLSHAELLEHGSPQDYVELTGTFLKSPPLQGEEGFVYVPLGDPVSGLVTYVQAASTQTVPEGPVKVRGMLHFVGSQLARQIPQEARYNRNQYLRYGEQPAGAGPALGLMLVTLPLGLLLFSVWTRKYIIFQAGGDLSAGPSSEPGSVGVTGRFAHRRFLDLDCQMKDLEFTGHADKAECKLQLEPGSLEKVEAGTLYLGKVQRPALRFLCRVVGQKKRQQLVLSFHTESQRRHVYERLITSAKTP